MAKISTTIVIEQGQSSANIDADGFCNINIWGFNANDAEKTLQSIEDLESVINALKNHLTDRH